MSLKSEILSAEQAIEFCKERLQLLTQPTTLRSQFEATRYETD